MTTTDAQSKEVAALPASAGSPERHGRMMSIAWLCSALAIVTAGYGLVAARNPGFFLVDDTESAILPMFSHLGSELRDGVWPGISERNWTVGLAAGDPQYGLFHPFSLFTYWLVDPISSLVWRIFLIVLIYVNLLAGGAFWAARALGSSAPFAALAAVIAGLNVFILYWHAAGWTTMLPGVSWYVVGVAALLAAVEHPERPWRAVVAGLATALVVASGSPFALVAFVLTAVALAAWTFVGRSLRIVRTHGLTIAATASGAVLGAVPWVVALDYIPFTRRSTGSYNNGVLTLHLESLVMSFSPSVRPFMGTFQGFRYLDQPATYGSWLFAGAVAVLVISRVKLGRSQWAILTSGAALFLVTLGPEVFGPIRWPFRFVPFALIMLALATVVVVERSVAAPLRSSRWYRLALIVATAVLTAMAFSSHVTLFAAVVTAVAVGAGVPLVVWCVRNRRPGALVVTGLASTCAVWVAIVLANPETTDLIDLGGPGDIGTAREDISPLAGYRTLQLVESTPAESIRTVLSNNYPLYASDPAETIAGYTSLWPKGLGALLCVRDPGYVCPAAPRNIFTTEPGTGERYIDLLGVNQVLVQRGQLLDNFELERSTEWVPAIETEWWVMYRNGTALGGSPAVWTSDGGQVEQIDGAEQVSLPSGGQLVLSRPWWPGTTVEVGGVSAELDPVADVFVRATFDEPVSGELSIEHEVPGRSGALAAALVGVLGLAACVVVAFRRGRRAAT